MSNQIVKETLPELRDALLELLKAEDDRANGLNGRGTALTGFVGVVLSVAAAAALAVGRGPALDWRWARIAVPILVAAALVALLLSVLSVVFRVLRPTPGETIGIADTDAYNSPKFTNLNPPQFHRYLIDAYGKALKTERQRNNDKARWLTRSYYLVILGLACVAIAGFSATLDRYVGGADPASGREDHPRDRGRQTDPGSA